MTITKTYKFKLKPTAIQEKYFSDCISHCRYLFNVAKEAKEWAYNSYGLSYSYYDLANELPILKKQEPWLKEVPSQTLQDVLTRLDLAFQSFFKGGGYPSWAKKDKYKSITFKSVKQDTYNRVILPKIGSVKYFASQEIKGKMCIATVIKELDGYYICIVAKQEIEPILQPISESQAIGVDMGITYFAVTSDGEFVENPRFLKTELKKLRLEQRSLARKVRFSNNWYKQKDVVQKLFLKIKRKRLDFLHKLSTRLVEENDTIIVENLQLKNMTKSSKGTAESHGSMVKQKSGLNRSMLDLGIGILFLQLEYKAKWSGKNFLKINPAYTSQECSKCGHRSRNNRKSQSKFECESCGHTANADLDASEVIKIRGLEKSSVTQRKAVA